MILPEQFDLDNAAAYAAWRGGKLAAHPRTLGELVVEIAVPQRLTFAEREALLARCGVANMAIYASRTVSIEWREDADTRGAVAALERILADERNPFPRPPRSRRGAGVQQRPARPRVLCRFRHAQAPALPRALL